MSFTSLNNRIQSQTLKVKLDRADTNCLLGTCWKRWVFDLRAWMKSVFWFCWKAVPSRENLCEMFWKMWSRFRLKQRTFGCELFSEMSRNIWRNFNKIFQERLKAAANKIYGKFILWLEFINFPLCFWLLKTKTFFCNFPAEAQTTCF